MKKIGFLSLIALVFTLSGCSVITGIFKAGFIVGIVAVVVIIAIILWIISLFKK